MPEQQFIAPIAGIQINHSQVLSLAVILRCSVVLRDDLACPDCDGMKLKIKAYKLKISKTMDTKEKPSKTCFQNLTPATHMLRDDAGLEKKSHPGGGFAK